MIGSYIHIHPGENRIRYICTNCRHVQICLTYPEAQRTQKAHEDLHRTNALPAARHASTYPPNR